MPTILWSTFSIPPSMDTHTWGYVYRFTGTHNDSFDKICAKLVSGLMFKQVSGHLVLRGASAAASARLATRHRAKGAWLLFHGMAGIAATDRYTPP
jgi:hypothetical protein